MPLLLRTLVLLLLPTLAHAALVISPATPLAEPGERAGAYRPQQDAAVAWNGDRGLVVWRARVGREDVVLANHVDSTGGPLESAPLRVLDEGQSSETRVVALGERFLVTWNHYDNTTEVTRAALVAADGTIQHLGRIGPATFSATDLASNGTTAVVAGSSGSPDFQAVLVWIDEQGQVFASRTFGASLMLSTRVTSDGTSFFAITHHLQCGVYTCSHTFSLIRANADGTAEEPRVIRYTDESQSFDYVVTGVAASQQQLLVTFQEPRGVVGAMLFDREGNAASGVITVEDTGASGAPIAVASDGSGFVIAYPHTEFPGDELPPIRTTRLRRVSASGASEAAILAEQTRIVSLAWTGSGYLLGGWSETPGVTVTRLPPSGARIAGTPEYVLSHAPNQQETPASVWDGGQLFTAWEEFFPLENVWRVKFGRNDANGNALDGRGRVIASSEVSQRSPRVVFDGSRYLVLWTETVARVTTIHARRVTRDGVPSGDAFAVAPIFCTTDFDAAVVGDRVLVAHQSAGCDAVARPRAVVVTPIESNDLVSSSTVVAENVTFSSPTIASAGASALVIWSESVTRTPTEPCPYGPYEYCPPKQVLRGAVLGDGTVKRIALADDNRMMNREADIAWNGSRYLVAWIGGHDLTTPQQLYAQALSATGELLTGASRVAENLSFNYGPERRGSVSASASGFTIAWQRETWEPTLSVWRVTASGAPFDAEQVIEARTRDLRVPQLTQGPGRTTYLVYSLSGPDVSYLGHNRIVWRALTETERARAVRH